MISFHETPLLPRVLALALTVQGCDSDQTVADDCTSPEQPAIIGALVYEEYDCLPTEGCGKASLYRDGDRVQLLIFDDDGTVDGEARGVLIPAVAQQLDEAIGGIVDDAVSVGEFYAECLFASPSPPVVLRLPTTFDWIEFRYPGGCGPAGLAEISSNLGSVVRYLRDCESGPVELDYCHFDAKPNG